MKKRITVFLALLVFLAMLPETVRAEEPSVADNLIYEVENAYWDGSKLTVEGYIVNLNEEYHILGLEDAEFTVEDADGREFSDECKLNDKFQEAFLLRPMSKRPYNFTISKYRYKKSKYASLTKGVQVSFSEGSCTYGTCAGKRCKECGYTGVDLDEDRSRHSSRPLATEAVQKAARGAVPDACATSAAKPESALSAEETV